MPFGQKWGEGGGAYIISPWILRFEPPPRVTGLSLQTHKRLKVSIEAELWHKDKSYHETFLDLFSIAASCFMKNRRKKSIHHHRGTPLLLVCRPTPRSQSKKSYGVYHFPVKTREKGIHHRSGKKGIHHRASDLEKEKKEAFHGGGVYFFLP